jgi:hypothetical protein
MLWTHLIKTCTLCVYIHFSYDNNARKLKIFIFFPYFEVSDAAVQLFNKRTKQTVVWISFNLLPVGSYTPPPLSFTTIFRVTSTLEITPHPPGSKWVACQNKAVHRKSLQCTAAAILTLYNDFPHSELQWLLTNLTSFFEQTQFQVFRFVQQLFKWWLTLAFCTL